VRDLIWRLACSSQSSLGRRGLGHVEALEYVQRLPEQDPGGAEVAPAEHGLGHAVQDLGLVVRVGDLPRGPKSGVEVLKGFAMVASSPR